MEEGEISLAVLYQFGTKKHWSLSWRNYWVLMVTALQLISPDYLI
ncbi:hypothetical protein [Salmonella enterica]|nr:hypothetical protein [Salmonella enterica]